MTKFLGVNETIAAARNGNEVPFGINGGYLACFAKDYCSVPSSAVATDTVRLGYVRSDAYLDADLSKITFDDFGTGITLDITAETTADITTALDGGSLTPLTDNLDVATAAGSSSLVASVTTANRHKPLWAQLGMAWDPHCMIELIAVFAGDPGAGNLSWKIIGS